MARRRGESAPVNGKSIALCDCGSAMTTSGTCAATGHYPLSLTRCPIACPLCRRHLEWSGACDHCHGTRTFSQPETWTFPGDRYEVQGQHRVRIATGPRRACTPQENAAGDGIIRALVSGLLTPQQALGAIQEAMEAHGDLEEAVWEPGASG